MKNILCIVFISLAIVVGYIVGSWAIQENYFFKINLSDILNICTTFIIATVIAYTVSNKTAYNSERRKMMLTLLEDYHGSIKNMMLFMDEYDNKNEHHLLVKGTREIKRAANLLHCLDVIDKTKCIIEDPDRYRNLYYRFKSLCTSSPSVKSEEEEKTRKRKIEMIYSQISHEILLAKTRMYV
jgi:hypothetical protein